MRTIALVNQKGGCGKTTTAINLAALYAKRGLRTLLVDMDPQAHCAAGLGVPEARIEYSIEHALQADLSRGFDPSALVWEVARGLHLAPSTMMLAALEAPGGGLHQLPDKDCRLEKLLELMRDKYDRCLIDCPPTIGLLTFNALRAAREVMIPVETGFFSLRGAQKQWNTIQRTMRHIGRPIACHMLATMHNPESKVAENILTALRRQFAGQIVPVVIHYHELLREAASLGQPVVECAPESAATADFRQLADWLEEHAGVPMVELTGEQAGMVEQEAGRLELVAELAGASSVAVGAAAGTTAVIGNASVARLSPHVARHDRASQGANQWQPSSAGPVSAQVSGLADLARGNGGPRAGSAMLAAARGGRAAEMVRKVHDLAQRSAERTRELDVKVSRAMEQDGVDIGGAGLGCNEPQRVEMECTSGPQAPATEASRAAEAISRMSRWSDRLQPPSQTLRLEAERPPVQSDASAPSPLDHVCGVRMTSAGALFVQPGDPRQSMAVAGDFNRWSATADPLRYNHEVNLFERLIPLPPGEHQYRLVVDGRWLADSFNPHQQFNSYGEPNSVVVVPAGPSAT